MSPETQALLLDGVLIVIFVYTLATIINHLEETRRLREHEKAELDRLRRLAQLYDRKIQ